MTPAVVAEAMRNSGYAPFNPSIIMDNCWVDFKTLSASEAHEFIRISETSVRAITERNGIVYPQECMDALQASALLNQTIQFPEVRENFQDLAWNRQLTIDLSHSHFSSLVAGRAQAVADAAQARVELAVTQQELARRDNLRYDHCCAGEVYDEVKRTMKHNCKCGGKFSNGIAGFKAHEKNAKKHLELFPAEDWEAFYARNAANPAPRQPVATAAPALVAAPAHVAAPAAAPAPAFVAFSARTAAGRHAPPPNRLNL